MNGFGPYFSDNSFLSLSIVLGKRVSIKDTTLLANFKI